MKRFTETITAASRRPPPASPATPGPQADTAPHGLYHFVKQSDTVGEFTGPAGKPPFASVAGPKFLVDAGLANRFACEQTGSSDFANSIQSFDEVVQQPVIWRE